MWVRRVGLLGTVLFCICQTAWANPGFELRASTLGFGGEINYGFSRFFTAGIGYNRYSYETDFDVDDVKYDADLDLQSWSLLGHYHPFAGIFRLTFGAMLNSNGLEMSGKPTGTTYEIGDRTYTAAEVGQLNGDISFEDFSPYFGVGWGKAFNSRFGMTFDIGVLFQSEPDVEFTATGPIASDPTFINDLKREEQRVEDDVKVLQFYPVLGLGIYFRFK